MGQLIKLQDYISRYEIDIYKYPSRFIRLKRMQWDKLHEAWASGGQVTLQTNNDELDTGSERERVWTKVKRLFSKQGKFEEDENEMDWQNNHLHKDEEQLMIDSLFNNKELGMPTSMKELKMKFLEEIFQVQLVWASSTISEHSYIDYSYYKEKNLKYFIQRFPDTFLFLYKPIFLLKKAPVESETILLTPTDAYCITFLEDEPDAVFLGSEDHFWEMRTRRGQEKILNPLIALHRTESIAKGIWKQHDVDFKIKKIIISRNGYIDFPSVPFGVTLIDQRNYEEWFKSMRQGRSPLKNIQLKAARSLLYYCKTVSAPRIGWDH